jgi:hypothetical protein
MRLSFNNPNGSGAAKYVSPFKREYTFGRETPQTIELFARPSRFMGTLGIYNPGERWAGSLNANARLVAVESEVHFGSMDELRKFLYEGSAIQKWVYNQEGYVVGYFESPGREQRNLTLYRYFIKGKPARFLPGYDNAKVRVSDEQVKK